MQRERYPDNWETLAFSIKQAACWHCQDCGRPCRPPGMDWDEFVEEVVGLGPFAGETCDTHYDEETGERVDIDRPGRFTLTVAHLDQDPSNNELDNLRALCAPCHLRYDRPWQVSNRLRKLERAGQLTLW